MVPVNQSMNGSSNWKGRRNFFAPVGVGVASRLERANGSCKRNLARFRVGHPRVELANRKPAQRCAAAHPPGAPVAFGRPLHSVSAAAPSPARRTNGAVQRRRNFQRRARHNASLSHTPRRHRMNERASGERVGGAARRGRGPGGGCGSGTVASRVARGAVPRDV